MSTDDLSYFEQLMGGGAEDQGESTGGIWVVSPDGALDDGILRLVGKARVAADALGSYVYLLLGGGVAADDTQPAIHAGADQVMLAQGVPGIHDLVEVFEPRAPQVVLFPATALGRALGPGLGQALGGSVCGYAADLAIDPMYQRLLAHKPVLGDAARQVVALLKAPAVVVMDTGALPAAFSEPWRNGQVNDLSLSWGTPADYGPADYQPAPVTLANAPVVVAGGRGLRNAEGFKLARRLAEKLGGVVAGDLGAMDAGWIGEEQLLGLTGRQAAPKLYMALGIDGDTEHLAAVKRAGAILSVQPDSSAPITKVADWNVIADPVEFAAALLARLDA